jgi:hypothetical protein
MWIDSVTLAVRRLDALDGLWDGFGLRRRTLACDSTGAGHVWISLGTLCLEFIGAVDRAQLRQFTWGRALLRFLAAGEGIFRVVVGVPQIDEFIGRRRAVGVRFWPPLDEAWVGCDDAPIAVRVSQMDPLFPWIITYAQPKTATVSKTLASVIVEVGSHHPATLAFQYQTALGRPITQSPTGTPWMALENGGFAFVQGAYTGFGGLIVRHGQQRAVIRVQDNALSLRIE